ncbi:hypothetical protein F4776DRAFT_573545 [Hypoxylon sp. NC0597]|nr:hypothetical protein F4776DRAFT_573545 [Hypoxylon sp. NC0597]
MAWAWHGMRWKGKGCGVCVCMCVWASWKGCWHAITALTYIHPYITTYISTCMYVAESPVGRQTANASGKEIIVFPFGSYPCFFFSLLPFQSPKLAGPESAMAEQHPCYFVAFSRHFLFLFSFLGEVFFIVSLEGLLFAS